MTLRYDRQNLHPRFSHVVEHADIAYSQSKLRTREAAQPLDPALALLRRFMPQMSLNRVF